MLINILVFSLLTFLPHFPILQSIVLCDRDPRVLVCQSSPLFLLMLACACGNVNFAKQWQTLPHSARGVFTL